MNLLRKGQMLPMRNIGEKIEFHVKASLLNLSLMLERSNLSGLRNELR